MTSFPTLMLTEMRRCLSRRGIRWLILVGTVGAVAIGVIAFLSTKPAEVATGENTVGRLTNLWNPGAEEATLLIPLMFLGIGAFLGGAMVSGAEWKHASMPALVTWEPDRRRLLGARLLACAALTVAIGAALLVLFVVSMLPLYFTRGTTEGFTGAMANGALLMAARGLLLAAFAAVIGAAVANLMRSTAGAVSLLFALQAVIEPIIRVNKPRWSHWTLGENLAAWVTNVPSVTPFGEVTTGPAAGRMLLYLAVVSLGALAAFQRRDLGRA